MLKNILNSYIYAVTFYINLTKVSFNTEIIIQIYIIRKNLNF